MHKRRNLVKTTKEGQMTADQSNRFPKVSIDLSKYESGTSGLLALSKEQIDEIVKEMILEKASLVPQISLIRTPRFTVKTVVYQEIVNLEKLNLKTRRAVVAAFLLKTFKGTGVYTSDGLEVGMSKMSANKLSRLTFDNQQEIALWSDNLLQIGLFRYEAQDADTENKNSKYRYYDSFISFGKDLFSVQLNVHQDSNGARLYDINKITSLQRTDSEGRGSHKATYTIPPLKPKVKKP